MVDQWWSWLLSAWTCLGLLIAGNRTRRTTGWFIALCGEVLWVAYAVETQQWGFLAGAVVFSSVYLANLIRAYRYERRERGE